MYALDMRGLRGGLGSGEAGVAVLNHDLVQFRPSAVYLRLTNTPAEVLNYAAGGFHVSVSRGECGGCHDSAIGYAKGGTIPFTCVSPIDDDSIKNLWIDAADDYKTIFNMILEGQGTWQEAVSMLRDANLKADLAYAAEQVPPPRDPGPDPSVPPAPDPVGTTPEGAAQRDTENRRSKWAKYAWWGVAVLGAGALVIGGVVYAGKDKDEKKAPTERMSKAPTARMSRAPTAPRPRGRR